MRPGRARRLAILAVLLIAAAAAAPWAVRTYWSIRSSNPVRRGVEKARHLGCFSCHGPLGADGIPDPGARDLGVPGWTGGVWMMYVDDDDDIRETILHGSVPKLQGGAIPAVRMPAYERVLTGRDLDDLVAAFKALSGMSRPPMESAAGRGLDVARAWRCFSCHGAAGSGGLPNPGSFTGFVPGWYGADFDDLVRDRQEFDDWILEGSLVRLDRHPIASFFVKRQRLSMPAYREMSREARDDLWAYVQWLRGQVSVLCVKSRRRLRVHSDPDL